MNLAFGLALVLGLAGVLPANGAAWLNSLEVAKAQAAASGRPILISFGGSDWCTDCNSLRSRILDTAEFHEFADARLVLLDVDSPRARPLAAMQKRANDQLVRKYNVTAFPALILAKPNGDAIGSVSGAGTPSQFVAILAKALSVLQGQGPRATGKPPGAGAPIVVAARGPAPAPTPVPDLPLFGGATTYPVPGYTNLVLKNIAGSATHRFALINSETMAPGDSAWLKLGETRVHVRCLEVRAQSVLVEVSGEPGRRELRLGAVPGR